MFDKLKILIGEEALFKIKSQKVLVVGLGGVGGYTVSSLIRSGIEDITLVDFDNVNISNINRQITAFSFTVGMKKIDVLEKMILGINPNAKIRKHPIYLHKNNIEDIFGNCDFDYVIDTCDSIEAKQELIKMCLNRKIKIISCMGTGNKLFSSKLEITELSKTKNDPVARILRRWAKGNNINDKITVVSSTEIPRKRGNIVSSNSYVPAIAGLLITEHVINEIIDAASIE